MVGSALGALCRRWNTEKMCFRNNLVRALSSQTWVDFSWVSLLDSQDFSPARTRLEVGPATGDAARGMGRDRDRAAMDRRTPV